MDLNREEVAIKSESPIETEFGTHLLRLCKNNGIPLQQQVEISVKRNIFRVDFLIQHQDKKLIIECDGHEEHHATKEQVARDNKRTRLLVGVGYQVIRFSGSEIFRNAEKCANETISILLTDKFETDRIRWIEQQRYVLANNLKLLNDQGVLLREYPHLHKTTKQYREILNVIHEFAASKIYNNEHLDENGYAIFYISTTEISNRLTRNNERKIVNKRINFLVYLGLINKIHPRDLPSDLYISARNHQRKQGRNMYLKTHYSIPSYTNTLFDIVEERARYFKQERLSVSSFTRDLVFSIFGQDEADRVFPQDSNKKDVSDNTKLIESRLVEAISLLMNRNDGYALVNEVIDYMMENSYEQKHISKRRFAIKMNVILPSLLEECNLIKKPFTKELKKKFGVEGMIGQPHIIINDTK